MNDNVDSVIIVYLSQCWQILWSWYSRVSNYCIFISMLTDIVVMVLVVSIWVETIYNN